MKKIILLMLINISLIAQNKVDWNGFTINLDDIHARKDTFNMIIDNEKVGSWSWTVKRDKDKITLKDISILDGQIWEEIIAKTDTKLKDYDVILNLETSRVKLENDFTWNGSSIKGSVTRTMNEESQTFPLDSTYQDVIPRFMLIALLPSIELQSGATREINLYAFTSHQVWPVVFKVAGNETVTVPAGTFETTRVEIPKTGERGVSNIFYVSNDAPKRIVKADVLEQNMTIELVE